VMALIDQKLPDAQYQLKIDFLRPQAEGGLQEGTRTIPENIAPTFLIAFLKSFGVVVPLLVIAFGIVMIRLGVRLRSFNVVAGRWSISAYMWMMVGLIVIAVHNFWVTGQGGFISSKPFNFSKGLSSALPPLLMLIPIGLAFWWLDRVIDDLFIGEETLSSRRTRFAWNLLIPTLALLVFVAARPLEQSFFRSLTNDQFSTSQPTKFVGLDNYSRLLSVKLTTVSCMKDPATNTCKKSANGLISWNRSKVELQDIETLRQLTPAQRENFARYQEVNTIKLPRSDKGLRLIAKDPAFIHSFFNTMHFTIASVVLETLLGLIIALVVNSGFRGRGLMRAAMLVPWAIPTVVSAVLWQTIMRPDQTGILNKLLVDLSIISKPQQWLGTTGPWMNAIISIDVWKTTPFMALLILAGLQVIPKDLYEAASVDGAGKVRQFFSITLPLLRPAIAVALVFRTLDALRVFDVFQVLLDSTRPSMAYYNYDRLVAARADGYASAVGVLIFILIFIFTVIYVRFVGIEQK
jgi:trehalose/maltose transport system permease protein